MKKIAFIGSGTMGTALATAACKGIDPSEVVITDVVTEKGQKLADELGCNFVETNGEAIKAAHYVVFCVKPQFLKSVLEEVKPVFAACAEEGQEKIIVSIVAGVERIRVRRKECSGYPYSPEYSLLDWKRFYPD